MGRFLVFVYSNLFVNCIKNLTNRYTIFISEITVWYLSNKKITNKNPVDKGQYIFFSFFPTAIQRPRKNKN